MNRSIALVLVLAATGCAVPRVAGPLRSDPLVDIRTMPLVPRVAASTGPSDEQVAGAVQLALRGRLADLAGDCATGLELLESAARLAPTESIDEARREHEWRCPEALGSHPTPTTALASR